MPTDQAEMNTKEGAVTCSWDDAIEGVKREIEALEAQNAELRAECRALLAMARKGDSEKYTELLSKHGAFLASIQVDSSE